MKKILGLDIGTNSIGWSLINQDFENKTGNIVGMGSRIIPMSQDILTDFGKGNTISQTAARTSYRAVRRLRERHLLRRERLHRVLNTLDWLPADYAKHIDFENKLGQFIHNSEPKLPFDESGNFIFKNSFLEMLEEFKLNHPNIVKRKNKKGETAKVPYDWTIYYLRKKALSKKITPQELSWIILNFNQKRGYYQLRGEEEEEKTNKSVEFHSLEIVKVEAETQSNNKGELWYSLHLENGWTYRRSSKIPLQDWEGKTRDFIVTTDIETDGTVKKDKDGNEKRSFRSPKEDDWTLLKKKTEQLIDRSKLSVGEYIFNSLLQKPDQKIRGKRVRTIERKYYKKELIDILSKQSELQPDLFSSEQYDRCISELYPYNEAHRNTLRKKNLVQFIAEDIIFFQRPLKSKKSSVARCSLESRTYQKKDENGMLVNCSDPLKAAPKSHPIYQEFRVWQWLQNLKIYKKETSEEVTSLLIPDSDTKIALFDYLMTLKEADHQTLLKFFFQDLKGKAQKEAIAKFRWNYVYDEDKDESKIYPMNETGTQLRKRLKNVGQLPKEFLNQDTETHLWHIIYSVTDKQEYSKALKSFARRYNEKYSTTIDIELFHDAFIKFPPIKNDYGSFSIKAIKKIIPLMRQGQYWSENLIDPEIHSKINKMINGEYDENIPEKVREKVSSLSRIEQFQGLPLWLAQYIVYNRHSAAKTNDKWTSVKHIEHYLQEFKQHSLRNPIVEQIVLETLRVVKDIWLFYGQGKKNFFDEIHIELGRDMKNTAEKRKRMTSEISANEATNERIKRLIAELKEDHSVENVRPHSHSQQEILKIYEEGVLASMKEVPKDIEKISQTAQPSRSELQKYKLWLEQKYSSPYTGQPIPLNRLFTSDYEIEHIIPQSKYFDNSMSNKVICESAVNQLKDNQLGLSFIQRHEGSIVALGTNRNVKVFTVNEYKKFVRDHYKKNQIKRTKLLLDEIPDKMIERQINDTRYISKFVSHLLSNLVREDHNDGGLNSKNLLAVNGSITNRLKYDWGLNNVWNTIILPRFQRMNQLTNSQGFTKKTLNGHYIPTVPLELSKGFQKKRIDHRHHALDALVIACATRDHINLLNNMHAKSSFRFDLNRKLRHFKKVAYLSATTGEKVRKEVANEFIKPWPTITRDTANKLEAMVTSFKQNLRIINKTTNYYQSFKDENDKLRLDNAGNLKKGKIKQTKGDSWAIRKPLHKETVAGHVKLDRIKVPKGKILTATRKSLDTSFDLKKIGRITDTGIQKILSNYLQLKGNKPEIAFTPEGIEDMNKHIQQFNEGKPHQPIKKVRLFELGVKFPLGQKGNKTAKYVEAAKGTNLFFGIYVKEDQTRFYETIPLNEVIERQKQGLPPVPLQNKRGKLLYHLSPNDLVYVPHSKDEQIPDFNCLTKEVTSKIYRMVSTSQGKLECVPIHYASPIMDNEIGSNNKSQNTLNGIQIKSICIKLSADRLGNLKYNSKNTLMHI